MLYTDNPKRQSVLIAAEKIKYIKHSQKYDAK